MSFRGRATFTNTELDMELFSKTLKKKLSIEHRQSVRVWLRKVLEETPVYTGTVKGTFQPVGRLVGRTIARVSNTTGKSQFKYKGKKVPLGFEEGANYATSQMREKDLGFAREYSFTFTRDLLYAMWNEMQPAPSWLNLRRPTPWQAILKANEAWGKYVKTQIFRNLPRIGLSIKVTKIKVR